MRTRITVALALLSVTALASVALANAGARPPTGSIGGAPMLAAAGDPAATVAVTGNPAYSFPARSFSTTTRHTGTVDTGGGAGSGEAILGKFVVTKVFSVHTLRLQKALLTGLHIQKVTVTLPSGAKYELFDAIVSEIDSSGRAGPAPTDRVAFSYRRLRATSGSVVVCWDAATKSSTCP